MNMRQLHGFGMIQPTRRQLHIYWLQRLHFRLISFAVYNEERNIRRFGLAEGSDILFKCLADLFLLNSLYLQLGTVR